MRLLLDAHQLGRSQTGNETYVRELARELRLMPELEIVAAVEAAQAPEGILAPPVRIRRVPRSGLGRLAALSLLSHQVGADITHTIYFLPVAVRGASVVTIHDISFERHPEFFSRSSLFRDRLLVRDAARRATRLVTVSETSRRDLLELWHVAPERVVAIPNGVSSLFRPPADKLAFDPADRPLRVLAVGTLQPRKNLLRLVDAVALVAREMRIVVRIVGPDGFQASQIRDRLGRAAQVEITGYVSQEQLVAEYQRADVFVYPSLYEGFGLPVIEAMASGIPVVTSTGGSLPEVAGDAALLVDPLDVAAIAAAIRRIASDANLRDRLRALGIARSARFTWHDAALAHLALYRDALA
jgi:glycosyltransferase involved in cell wall biosynthesis